MDPIANLKEQRALVKRMQDREDEFDVSDLPREDGDARREEYYTEQTRDGLRLAELVDALDGWILRGGFSPWIKPS